MEITETTIENLRKQIAEERPRCALCGRFFGIKQVIDEQVKSKIVVDTHFTTEQQWYEHKEGYCEI